MKTALYPNELESLRERLSNARHGLRWAEETASEWRHEIEKLEKMIAAQEKKVA